MAAATASVAPAVTSTSVSGSYVQAVEPRLVVHDGPAQLGDTGTGRVLVTPALQHRVRRGLGQRPRGPSVSGKP